MNRRPSPILYADDSEDDTFFLQHSFEEIGIAERLVCVPDGREATLYLAGEGSYADRERFPLPSLVLLDVKMPHLNGLETLEWIRGRDEFREVPVLMLTSSSMQRDVARAFASGADAFLVKPATLDKYKELARALAKVAHTCAAFRQTRLPGSLASAPGSAGSMEPAGE